MCAYVCVCVCVCVLNVCVCVCVVCLVCCVCRYYWEEDETIARIINATVKYQNEYLGNTGR